MTVCDTVSMFTWISIVISVVIPLIIYYINIKKFWNDKGTGTRIASVLLLIASIVLLFIILSQIILTIYDEQFYENCVARIL